MILPRGKEESDVVSNNEYSIFIGFAVHGRTTTTEGSIVKTDCAVNGINLGQMLVEIIHDTGNYAPYKIELETDSVIEYPLFQGAIEVEYSIEKAIGGSISF